MERRRTSQRELNEVIDYWLSLGRSQYYEVASLLQFLATFTPYEIRGGMYLACVSVHGNYFKYLCGILHNWRRDIAEGREPEYFELDE